MKIRYWINLELQIALTRNRLLIFVNRREWEGVWYCESCLMDWNLTIA